MTEHDDPLWNPEAPADDDLARIQRLLGRYGVRARELPLPAIDVHRGPRALPWVLAAGIALALLGGGYKYRLAWTPGSTWSVLLSEGHEVEKETRLAPGQSLSTARKESATIAVARIGRITLSPDSSLRLVETETGKHRVALEHGHMRARIWAPPGYFAVRADLGEVVDLGCDFDLWKDRNGSGRVFVRHGWVSYRIGTEDILVPGGYALSFADGQAQTPLRTDAPAGFVRAVHALEAAISSKSPGIDEAAQRVAETARDKDAFTLLSMLTRWPSLARTMLYPRLGEALGVREDSAGHRRAWEAGDQHAINAWWEKIPRQPKQWWTNWKDAVG